MLSDNNQGKCQHTSRYRSADLTYTSSRHATIVQEKGSPTKEPSGQQVLRHQATFFVIYSLKIN